MRISPISTLLAISLALAALLGVPYYVEWRTGGYERSELVDPGFAARTEAKQQVVEKLVHGRLTFGEAALRFQDLDRENPQVAATLGTSFPNVPAMERRRHQVMAWVARYAEDYSEAAHVLARLKAELQGDSSEASEAIEAHLRRQP